MNALRFVMYAVVVAMAKGFMPFVFILGWVLLLTVFYDLAF